MKKIINLLFSVVIGTLIFSSCSPEEIELGTMDVKPADLVEGIAFTIEHDGENANIVYLRSLMGTRYTPLWNHPQGRSQEKEVKLQIAFPGTYEVVYGVMTRGGIVYGDTATFEVEEMYAPFISDPIWEMIAGGANEEKTWYLDLDAEGVSRYFLGPMYFFRNWYTWDGLHTESGESYLDADPWNWEEAILPTIDREGDSRTGAPIPGVNAWFWAADWPGNQWMTPAADFGTMTFNLKGAANVIVDQEEYGLGLQQGTFNIDVENHTIKFSDAKPLHDASRNNDDVNWYDVQILYLNDDAMQLGIVPNGDAAAMTVYNYISKDYRDNWTPGDEPDPEPALPDGWKDDVSKTVNTTIIWKLSESNPLDWATLDGSMLNGWQKPEDYPDWLGSPDPSVYGNFSMTMNSDDLSVVFVNPDGTTISGTYSLDEKGIYSFDVDVPTFAIIGWASFAADANNQLRILKIEKDASDNVIGMWLGARSSDKDEYTAFHFVPTGGASNDDPLDAWKKAFVGKTFKPDVNWFVDWVNFPPDFTGGWTTAETFGDDYNTNNWVWTEEVRAVAESASLTFALEGDDIKLTLTQTKDGAPYTATGDVTIDPDNKILNISIPLVDYVGTIANWLPSTNTKTITGDVNDYYFVSHGGTNLSNIDTEGFWLGVISNSVESGDDNDEALIFHFVKQ